MWDDSPDAGKAKHFACDRLSFSEPAREFLLGYHDPKLFYVQPVYIHFTILLILFHFYFLFILGNPPCSCFYIHFPACPSNNCPCYYYHIFTISLFTVPVFPLQNYILPCLAYFSAVRWQQHIPQKCLCLFTQPHSITSHKISLRSYSLISYLRRFLISLLSYIYQREGISINYRY